MRADDGHRGAGRRGGVFGDPLDAAERFFVEEVLASGG